MLEIHIKCPEKVTEAQIYKPSQQLCPKSNNILDYLSCKFTTQN